MSNEHFSEQQESIAVIGLAGRFPGADSIGQFWENLCNGVESIATFSDEELLAAGADPKVFKNPHKRPCRI
jgi:acyl transferase domain-containing protein